MKLEVPLSLRHGIIFYVTATYIVSLANTVNDRRAAQLLPAEFAETPLPDVLFETLPFIPDAVRLIDPLAHGMYALVLIRLGVHHARKELIALFFVMHGTILLLRAALVALTTLPAPHLCSAENRMLSNQGHILIAPLMHLITPGGFMSWCNDLLFSGHAALLTLAFLVVNTVNGNAAWTGMAALIWLVGIACILLGHSHYSVDILLGMETATAVYFLYKKPLLELLESKPEKSLVF